MGMRIAMSLGGAVLTETTFEWKGLGFVMAQYMASRDFMAVQGIVMMILPLSSLLSTSSLMSSRPSLTRE